MSIHDWADAIEGTGEPIVCTRGHDDHATTDALVRLEGQSGYKDCPAIPERHARTLGFAVYDWTRYAAEPDYSQGRSDMAGYCPGKDVVSDCIQTLGMWEGYQTLLALEACAQGGTVVDVGSQIGWFSILAASSGCDVVAVDADPANLELLRESAKTNALNVRTVRATIEYGTPATDAQIRLLKVDVEGAENHVIDAMAPAFAAGRIDYALVEVSPVFADYYPDLVAQVCAWGYRACVVPNKGEVLTEFSSDPLGTIRDRYSLGDDMASVVASWQQRDVWFERL